MDTMARVRARNSERAASSPATCPSPTAAAARPASPPPHPSCAPSSPARARASPRASGAAGRGSSCCRATASAASAPSWSPWSATASAATPCASARQHAGGLARHRPRSAEPCPRPPSRSPPPRCATRAAPGRSCSLVARAARALARAADRRARRDLRPPAAAGRLRARPTLAARRDPAASTSSSTSRPAQRYGIDPWILAAIGKIETDHGRSTAPGVRSGVNTYGCCAGPMQFSIVGSPSTWDSYGVDGNHDGRRSPYDPEDAIPAAARYLRACGAPADYAARSSPTTTPTGTSPTSSPRPSSTAAPPPADRRLAAPRRATVRELLANPRIVLTPGQRADLRAGGIDPRLLATLAWIGRRHTVVDHRAARRPLPGHQPRGRPRDGHRRRRRRDLPRHPLRRAAPTWCASSPPSPARPARPS